MTRSVLLVVAVFLVMVLLVALDLARDVGAPGSGPVPGDTVVPQTEHAASDPSSTTCAKCHNKWGRR